jgi:hypothetical protein
LSGGIPYSGTRLKIAAPSTAELQYLHQGKIHRNPFDRQPMERCGTHKMIKLRTEIPSDSAQGSKS